MGSSSTDPGSLRGQCVGMMAVAQRGSQFHQVSGACRPQRQPRLQPLGLAQKLP